LNHGRIIGLHASQLIGDFQRLQTVAFKLADKTQIAQHVPVIGPQAGSRSQNYVAQPGDRPTPTASPRGRSERQLSSALMPWRE